MLLDSFDKLFKSIFPSMQIKAFSLPPETNKMNCSLIKLILSTIKFKVITYYDSYDQNI